MSHIKVMGSDGNCYGRVSIDASNANESEQKARQHAARIMDMHTNHKGDKGNSSPSSKLEYRVEIDQRDYPFDGLSPNPK